MVAPKRRSVSLPIVLSSVSVALSIALVVGWILVIVRNAALAKEAVAQNAWLLVGGITSFIVIMTVLVLFTVFLVREIREVRRQVSFIDSVTHELKSPLASLKLCAETMARPELEADRREQLRVMMLDDVTRLVNVIDGILQASRVGLGSSGKNVEHLALAPLVESAVAQVVARHHIQADAVRVDVPEELDLDADEHSLRTVVENLVDNAVKYSTDVLEIQIRARERSGRRVELTVSDRGIGIQPRDLKRIFQRFYRAPEEAVRSRHGTGLGLFVVWGLVRSLGGKIDASSPGRGRGTTFRIVLPRRRRPAKREDG